MSLFPPPRGEKERLEQLVIRHGQAAITNLRDPEYHPSIEEYQSAAPRVPSASTPWDEWNGVSEISLVDDASPAPVPVAPTEKKPEALDSLARDVVGAVLFAVDDVQALRSAKSASRALAPLARRVLTDTEWQNANGVTLHELLRGRASPEQLLAMLAKRPQDLRERDANGMLPLQYASSRSYWRQLPECIAQLRTGTKREARRAPDIAAILSAPICLQNPNPRGSPRWALR